MKLLIRALVVLLASGLCATSALADRGGHHHGHHHGHAQFGLYIGGPWYPWYYPPPMYYPPQVVVVPSSPPPVYIEQAPAYGGNQYWYFCQQANAYYPQITNCPAGWVRVPPRQ
jgi:hypothetical protein